MRTPTSLALAVLGGLLFPCRAQAADLGSSTTIEASCCRPSFRVGVFMGSALSGGQGHADFGSNPPPAGAGSGKADVQAFPLVMVGMNLGVQLDERLALYLRGEMASFLFLNLVSASLILEANLSPRWALAGGLGVAALRQSFLRICWPACLGPDAHDWSGLSVPLLLTYSFRNEVRRSWRATLESAFGADPRDLSETTGRLSLSVGYDWM